MKNYLFRRLFLLVPTLLGITLITFLLLRLMPGDPASLKIKTDRQSLQNDAVSREIIEQTRKMYGLDKPVMTQYLRWLKRLVTLDFGNSFQDQRPVIEKIKERLPITLQISIISVFLVYLISIPLGVYSAVKQYSLTDRIITVLLFILYSLPSFWIAILLIMFLGGGDYLNIFPIYGLSSEGAESFGLVKWTLDRIWHLVLPITCLTYGGLASLSRYMRAGMLEVIRQDYIRTARAKGLPEKVVIFKHALRNSLIPIITLLAYLLPAFFSGSVIIENIFSIPGMGKLAFESILARDYPTIMAIITISSFLTLAGILLSDLIYVLVDPRISFENIDK
ncbi:MAG: ABC transporter permease [bacterium]|nr:ABC transporter permease [bacterium]